MRKTLCVLFIGIFLLAGCGEKKNTGILILSNITFDADIVYKDSHYRAECFINTDKELTAKILSPKNLSGLEFYFKDDKCAVKYGEILFDDPDTYFPDTFSLKAVYNVILKSDNAKVISNKGNCKLSGNSGSQRYIITASPSGLPITIEIPDIDFKITFKNVSVKE